MVGLPHHVLLESLESTAYAQDSGCTEWTASDAVWKTLYLQGLGVPGGCHWVLRGQPVAEGALWG